jgi:alkylhydroperoxidase/carboxymuconolactone decarboxylase family protein YurZ
MVRALKASGATPEEIAKTMAATMGKNGASNEEIARVLAQALADSGATGEFIILLTRIF